MALSLILLSLLGSFPIYEFGGGSGAIFLDDVVCSGLEERLEHCSHRGIGVQNCDHSEDVGVICGSGTKDACNKMCCIIKHMYSYVHVQSTMCSNGLIS